MPYGRLCAAEHIVKEGLWVPWEAAQRVSLRVPSRAADVQPDYSVNPAAGSVMEWQPTLHGDRRSRHIL